MKARKSSVPFSMQKCVGMLVTIDRKKLIQYREFAMFPLVIGGCDGLAKEIANQHALIQ